MVSARSRVPISPETKFLDNLTKDLSLLLHAIHSPFYWWILKENSSLFVNRNVGRKTDKNSSLRRLEFTSKNLD
jgi:hypothetical protein